MSTLEHVGIAVEDPTAMATLLGDLLGLLRYKSEDVGREGVRTHFLGAGEAKIELLEPLADESPVSRFLSSRGEGVHHLAFEVDSLGAVIGRARAMGLTPLSPGGLPGADRKRIAFFHPRDTHGLLIEVCETVTPDEASALEGVRIFGDERSPAVVIVASEREGGAAVWSHVAGMLESEFYTVLVGPGSGEPVDSWWDPVSGAGRLHLVSDDQAIDVAARARESGAIVLSSVACRFESSRTLVSASRGESSGETYSLPPVTSRRTARLLAQLLVHVFVTAGTDGGG